MATKLLVNTSRVHRSCNNIFTAALNPGLEAGCKLIKSVRSYSVSSSISITLQVEEPEFFNKFLHLLNSDAHSEYNINLKSIRGRII